MQNTKITQKYLVNNHISVENYEKNIYLVKFVFPGVNILK